MFLKQGDQMTKQKRNWIIRIFRALNAIISSEEVPKTTKTYVVILVGNFILSISVVMIFG